MTRFIEKPFSELPDENDTYLLIRKDDCFGTDKYRGDHYSMEYCTEGGWNTWKDRKGEVFTDAEISAERLADHYKCWLKPVTHGPYRWAEAIADLIEEIKAKTYDFADYELTEDEEDTLDNLTDMIECLEGAMKIAEAFKE